MFEFFLGSSIISIIIGVWIISSILIIPFQLIKIRKQLEAIRKLLRGESDGEG